jgi:hypothetical protein
MFLLAVAVVVALLQKVVPLQARLMLALARRPFSLATWTRRCTTPSKLSNDVPLCARLAQLREACGLSCVLLVLLCSMLRAAFSAVGPVTGVKIGRRGNFGFVYFEHDGHAEDALRLSGSNIGGTEVVVEKANAPAPRRPRNAPAA